MLTPAASVMVSMILRPRRPACNVQHKGGEWRPASRKSESLHRNRTCAFLDEVSVAASDRRLGAKQIEL